MKPILAFIFVLLLIACKQPVDKEAYEASILEWDKKHEASLTATDGWLNLVGLFWFETEMSVLGSSKNVDIVLEQSDFPDSVGRFILKNDKVYFYSFLDQIKIDGQAISDTNLVFDPSSNITADITYQNFQWSVIQRVNVIGLRVRDLEAKQVKEFSSIERYPINIDWRLEAEFIPNEPGRTIPISNVIGQITETATPGKVRFSYKNQVFELDALDGGPDELFLIFADGTSGLDTYGGGRYLYIPRAGKDNKTLIDFNKAYNPPCVFTPYATCPLPPRQNILPIAVEAGHKTYDY